MTMTTYVVTVNVPGFLPEGEPTVCDTLSEAWYLLVSEVHETLNMVDEEHPQRGSWTLPPRSEVPLERSILLDRQWSWQAGGYLHTITQRKPSNGSREDRTVWSTDEGWAINTARGEYRCSACLPIAADVDPEDEVAYQLNLAPGEEPDYWVTKERLEMAGTDLTVDTPQHCYLCDVLISLPLSREGLDYVFLQVYDERTKHTEAILNAWQNEYEDQFPQCEKCDERFASQGDLDEHMPEHWGVKTWAEAKQAFDAYLDAEHEPTRFWNVTIYASDALKTDEVAYDEQINAWVEGLGIDPNLLRGL
jgi:hypothetical protein